jgi:hypothetical protein
MAIVDPGMTLVTDLGVPLLSPHARRVNGADSGNMPTPNPLMQQGPPQVMQNAPAPAPSLAQTGQMNPQGQTNFVKPASERYNALESQAPNRKVLQPHGISRVLNALTGIATGNPALALGVYHHLQDQPYNKASADWQQKLGAIKPELEQENVKTRESAENTRFNLSQSNLKETREAAEAHQRELEKQGNQRIIDQQEKETREATDNKAKREADEKKQTAKEVSDKQEKDIQNRRLTDQEKNSETQHRIEERRLNMMLEKMNKESTQGTYVLGYDRDHKPYFYNNKTLEIKEAPERGIERPSVIEKTQATNAPKEAAIAFADNYLKSGKYNGPSDEALMEKYFELAKTSSGFRMTKPQQDMLVKARSLAEGARATGGHLINGTYFDNVQRAHIVNTMKMLASASGIGGNVTSGTPKVAPPVKIIKEEDVP